MMHNKYTNNKITSWYSVYATVLFLSEVQKENGKTRKQTEEI